MHVQDNIGELDTDHQDELKRARRQEEEEEEKGRKSALLFGSEDTFDSIASVEEKVCFYLMLLIIHLNFRFAFKVYGYSCSAKPHSDLKINQNVVYKPFSETHVFFPKLLKNM